jgi:predicted nucleotidyltransferase
MQVLEAGSKNAVSSIRLDKQIARAVQWARDEIRSNMVASKFQDRRDDILRVTAKHGASNVRIFGSVARGEAGPGSDLDLLVDMEPGRSLFDLGAMVGELRALLGCEVDVVTESSLYWLLRRRILREARPL